MTSLRDTTADAAAALQAAYPAHEAADVASGPVTLNGRQVRKLVDVLTRTFGRLQRLEGDKRYPFRVREAIRADRITISAAIAHLEAASIDAALAATKPAAEGGADQPEPGSGGRAEGAQPTRHANARTAVGRSPAPASPDHAREERP